MTEASKQYTIDLTRLDTAVYRATNSAGASIEFGSGEGLLSPVELLLAAVAGCSAVDVDAVTSRRAEPDSFDVHVEGDRVNEDGASRLSEVRVGFDLSFPDTPRGQPSAQTGGQPDSHLPREGLHGIAHG